MTEHTIATTGCTHLAGPDRHAPVASVALPLSTTAARRPASAMHAHPTAATARSII